MNGLAICSGIGGLDLGLKIACPEYRTVCHIEREAYAVALLVKRMEEGWMDQAPVWSDLSTFDGTAWRGRVDIVHAGLPCQPYSTAGQRKGDKDERYIWPDFFRIVSEVQPPMVFLENVPGLLAWFQSIGEELCSLGYEFEAGLFSASEIGASHKRQRLFILAHSQNYRRSWWQREEHLLREGIISRDQRGDGGEVRSQVVQLRPDVAQPISPGAGNQSGEIKGETRKPTVRQGDREISPGRTFPTNFPPGPGEREAWAAILQRWPELAPAVADHQSGKQSEQSAMDGKKPFAGTSGGGQLWGTSEGTDINRRVAETVETEHRRDLGDSDQPKRRGRSETERCQDSTLQPSKEPNSQETQPAVRGMANGISSRVDQLRALGNAVVPVVAAVAFVTLSLNSRDKAAIFRRHGLERR